jgi:16S rRNA (uracil1498-N3)-methyltransferase
MHRLLVTTETLQAEAPSLPEAARRHLKAVRPKEGEPLELFDGAGATRVYAWRDGRLAAAGALERAARPSRELVLFACVTKGARWDWTIEKATELGVTRLVPVLSARTIVRLAPDERAAKCERWRRISEEAARQSDAKWLPEIDSPVDFPEAVKRAAACACYVGALTDPPPKTILEVATADDDGPLGIFVGPEGDFTPEELAALLAVATPVSFGSTILRAETAAIYGAAVLKALMDAAAGKAGG